MTDVSQTIQQTFTVDTYVNRGLTFVRGDGVYLYTEDGTAYLDCMSNYGVNILGHSHPVVTAKLANQLGRITTLHSSFANDTRSLAAKALVKRCGSNLKQVYFGNSGAEAVEAALKFAVLTTQKKHFIVAAHGYHGKTLGALSATAEEKYKAPFAPLLWDFQTVPFGTLAEIEHAIKSDTAAVILEPIQGEGGIFVPPNDYLQHVRALCDKHGTLLIIDEIQTGAGRTGTFLASEASQISADIVCLGKGLAGGIPVGVTLVNERVARAIPKHIHTSTFGGNPLAAAGILATLELVNDDLLAHVREVGEYTKKQIHSTVTWDGIKDIRGVGLMIGIEVTEKRNEILKALQNKHVLAIPAGDTVIRLLPPFIIEKKHIDQFVTALSEVTKAIQYV